MANNWFSFSDLPSIIPDYTPLAQSGMQAGKMISEALQNRKARRSQEAQAAARLEYEKGVAAQRAAHDTAVLGEDTRHNQAVEASTVAAREAEMAKARAAAIAAGGETLLKSGGNSELARNLNAAVQTLGGGESSASAPGGTSYPGQLSRFPGAELGQFMPRTSALLGGSGQSVQPGAQPVANDTPAGAATPDAGGGQVPTFSGEAMRQASLGDGKSLQGISEMPSTLPIVRQRRAAAVKALEGVAFPNEAERVKAIEEMASNAERNETSIVNAARQAEAVGGRFGQGQERLKLKDAITIRDRIISEQMGKGEYQKIDARIRAANRTDELLKLGGGTSAIDPGDQVASASRAALAENTRALYGAASSNKELAETMKAGGFPAQMEEWMNVYFNGGQIAQVRLEELGRMARLSGTLAKQEKRALADKAANAVRNDTGIMSLAPDLAERMANDAGRRVWGGGAAEPPSPWGGAGDGGGGSGENRSSSKGGILAYDPDEVTVDE